MVFANLLIKYIKLKNLNIKAYYLGLKTIVFLVMLCSFNFAEAQLVIRTNRSVSDLVKNVLASKGVEIPSTSIQSSTNLEAIAFFDGRSSNLGLDSGIFLSTGRAINARGPNLLGNTGTSNNQPGDADILSINPNNPNFDASWISFDVIPESDSISFRFVFASEEYPEFVNQSYNDVFGLFIEGLGFASITNLALIPGTQTPVSIQNVNHLTNSQFYRDNIGGTSVSFDGFTTIIEAKAQVVPCTPYKLKFVIADINDYIYDSGIFIEAQSLKSLNDKGITVNFKEQVYSECDSVDLEFIRNSNNTTNPIVVDFELFGTAKESIDFDVPFTSQITIPAGARSAKMKIKPVTDGIPEPAETINIKIKSPVICDTIIKFSTLVDYKRFDSVEFKYVCADSGVVISIRDYDLLDSIAWTNDDKLQIATGPVANLPRSDTGYFYIRAIEKCTGRKIIDSVKIRFYDVVIETDTIICLGDTLYLKAISALPGAKYEWTNSTGGNFSPSPLSANPYIIPENDGYIYVGITNDGVCGINLVKIKVVVLKVSADSVQICGLGNSIQLNASGGTKYVWTPNLYLSNDTVPDPITTPPGNMVYKVDISNGECSESFEVKIRIDTPITVFANEDIYVCTRQFADLNAEGSPDTNYVWSPIKGLDNPFSKNPRANPISTTTYYVTGYNGSCESVDSVTVYVVNPIESSLEYSFDSCNKTFIGLQKLATDSTEIIWDMGNGDVIKSKSIAYTYDTPGTYIIRSLVDINAPCADSEIVNINMPAVDIAKRRIPEAFSPNGDGNNDEFKVYFGNLPCAVEQFKIYNRWGQLMYDHKDREALSWDGTYNGEPCSPGVYVYFLKGEGFQDSGWFVLLK
jgi:gliding motility-associated-like protein